MRATRFNSLSQLATVMAGFAVTIVLLESEALLTWADRLDVGPERARAVQATTALHKKLHPLGVERVREEGLDGLDRLGWTDDPARLRAAREKWLVAAGGTGGPCVVPVHAPGMPKLAPPNAENPSVQAVVPKTTPLPPLAAPAQGQPRVVALVGDSMMAVGMSDVLLRETADNPNVRVLKAFKSGTGLARPDVFDWMQEYPAMIGDEKPDAVIVAIGANDGQGIVEDGKALPYGSDAWVKAYEQRTADFLNLLTQNGAHVVWMGLPPMKAGGYNGRAAEINRITYSVVSQNPQATWWNPESYVGDEGGGFRDVETLPGGKTIRIRQADGIHLSDEGAALLAPELLHWLNPAPQPAKAAQLAAKEEPAAAPKGRAHGRHVRTARP